MDTLSTEYRVPLEIRHLQILDIINSRNFTHVRDLSAHFRVSRVTIQGDLALLAAQGHIQRLRGGARPQKQARSLRPAPPGARVSNQANLEQATDDSDSAAQSCHSSKRSTHIFSAFFILYPSRN